VASRVVLSSVELLIPHMPCLCRQQKQINREWQFWQFPREIPTQQSATQSERVPNSGSFPGKSPHNSQLRNRNAYRILTVSQGNPHTTVSYAIGTRIEFWQFPREIPTQQPATQSERVPCRVGAIRATATLQTAGR
jgi:hypothetical protein